MRLTRTVMVLGLFVAMILAPMVLAPMVLASQARAEPAVSDFRLDNGMEVVVIEDHRAPVVTHMVWYRVGAADEPWGHSGIAHFFEHLMFKATGKIADGAFSKIVAANGGSDNAFTSYDYTAYFQRIAADRLGLVMGMEADRMRNLALSDEVIATERDVILEERNQRTDNSPQGLFAEQMDAALYMNHPYGVPVIGWRHEIEQLNLTDANDFYGRYYAPDNAILVVAGDVTPDEVRKLAETHYGPLQPSGRPAEARPQEPPQLTPRRLEMRDERVRQPFVRRIYLVPTYDPENQREAAALSILSDVLGDGITSAMYLATASPRDWPRRYSWTRKWRSIPVRIIRHPGAIRPALASTACRRRARIWRPSKRQSTRFWPTLPPTGRPRRNCPASSA
jgi:zinc protease